jgi:hypothetical protein
VSQDQPKLSLDMGDEKDRAMTRMAMRRWPRRWRGLTDAVKDELAESLRMANEAAQRLAANDNPEIALEGVKMIPSIVRTGVLMEAQCQADEHLADKNERLDSGKATENVGILRVLKPDVMKPKE